MRRKVSVSQRSRALKRYMAQKKVKPSFWEAFIEGVSSLMPTQPRAYIHPTGGGFSADNKALRDDFGAIGMDMRKALKKYEQTNSNKR